MKGLTKKQQYEKAVREAKKQEERGQFDSVWHMYLKGLKPPKKKSKSAKIDGLEDK